MDQLYGKKNNGGFSLVELIVIVLILGIVAATAIMSLSAMMRANTTKAAKELSAVLDKTRTMTMSQVDGSVALHLYRDGKGQYCADIRPYSTTSGAVSEESDPVVLSKGSLGFTARQSGSAAAAAAVDEAGIDIVFSKKTGKCIKNSTGDKYDAVVISAAKTSTVYIVNNTGRNYIE